MLAEYEHLNHDLPPETRRQLALFVLATKVRVKVLEELFERPLGQTYLRHRAWMWYTAMRTSGLEHLWPEFAYFHNEGVSMRELLKTVQKVTSSEQWLLLSKRLGVPVFKGRNSLNPYWYSDKGAAQKFWTKGGTWDRRNGFTKIIVLGEHIDRKDNFNTVTALMVPALCRQLESEIHHLVDPDATLVPEAIKQAVTYARTRIPQLVGHRRPTTSYKVVSWFFQERVPHPYGGYVNHLSEVDYPRSYRGKVLEWLP